jgi:predicted SnoaL-like aldol condensation-catalyzing enzyme
MSNSNAEKNKSIVLEAFDTLFNKRDYTAAERFWSPRYIQHSAHIEPGRDGLFNLIKAAPPSLKYEPGVILAEDDYVIVHGRFSNIGLLVNWIAADVVRLKDGILVEHWDVIQDEATEQQSRSGNPMFGDSFPGSRTLCNAQLCTCGLSRTLSRGIHASENGLTRNVPGIPETMTVPSALKWTERYSPSGRSLSLFQLSPLSALTYTPVIEVTTSRLGRDGSTSMP